MKNQLNQRDPTREEEEEDEEEEHSLSIKGFFELVCIRRFTM